MKPRLFDIWPDFEPVYDENEYSWTTLRSLDETLLLNCGECDGPSDLRHLEKWLTVMLCRIHSPD